MSGRSVYLAGPVDNIDGRNRFRDDAIQLIHDDIDIIDPYVKFPDYSDDPSSVVDWCIKQAEENDILVVGLGYVKTTGTHYEIERALCNGNRVVAHIYDEDNLSKFVRHRKELEFAHTIPDAVDRLHKGWSI